MAWAVFVLVEVMAPSLATAADTGPGFRRCPRARQALDPAGSPDYVDVLLSWSALRTA